VNDGDPKTERCLERTVDHNTTAVQSGVLITDGCGVRTPRRQKLPLSSSQAVHVERAHI